MSDLLSDSDREGIKNAIKDVTDTFAKSPVTLKKRTKKMTAFRESVEENNTPSETVLNALVVYDDNKHDKEISGSKNVDKGYALFNFEDLNTASLIDGNQNPTIDPSKDLLSIDGRDYTLLGVNKVGPNGAEYLLVKVPFEIKLIGS